MSKESRKKARIYDLRPVTRMFADEQLIMGYKKMGKVAIGEIIILLCGKGIMRFTDTELFYKLISSLK